MTRDGKAVATDSIQKSSDGKTITINSSASLVAGDYVVAVGELTFALTCETSKVDIIEFLSDKAAVVESTSNRNIYDKATVGYRVLNQFGDDITKTTMLTVNASVAATLNASDHQITFTAPNPANGFMLGRDMITCVLLDTNTGKNASASLTCDMKAYAKTLTFEGIYNQDGKSLTEDTDFAETPFFMLFTAEDQYGQTFKNYKNVTESTDIYVTVVGGLTGVDRTASQTFGTVEKDGKTYLAYPLAWNTALVNASGKSAGTVNVQALSSGGASCAGTFEVAEGGRPVSISAVAPAVIPAGEKTEIPYTALNAAGKEVTSYKYLKAGEVTISGSNNVSFVRQADGSAKLILDATTGILATVTKNNRTPVTFTMQTKNHKISTLTVYVTENARPVAIDGLQDVTVNFDKNTTYVPVKLKNLKVEDQYGRVMSADALQKAARNADVNSAYALRTVKANVIGTGNQIVSLTANRTIISTGAAVAYQANYTGPQLLWTEVTSSAIATAALGNANIGKDDVLFYVKASMPAKIGFANINFAIDNSLPNTNADSLNSTNANVQFNVKDTAKVEAASVEVNDVYIPDHANAAKASVYKQNVVVKANGVTLPRTSYSIEDSGDFVVTNAAIDGTPVHAIYASKDQDDYTEFSKDKKQSIKKVITVTLNGTGEKITKEVVLNAEAPKVAVVNLKSDEYFLHVNSATTPTVVSNDAIFANIDNVKDQYGVKLNLATGAAIGGAQNELQYTFASEVNPATKSAIITFIGADDSTTITDNGTSKATMQYNSAFTGITMNINYGGVSKQIKIYR